MAKRVNTDNLVEFVAEAEPAAKPKTSTTDYFNEFKINIGLLSKHDQEIFLRHILKLFTAEEVIDVMMG